eukprot:jgi/Chlat1/2869/Chrsp195S03023
MLLHDVIRRVLQAAVGQHVAQMTASQEGRRSGGRTGGQSGAVLSFALTAGSQDCANQLRCGSNDIGVRSWLPISYQGNGYQVVILWCSPLGVQDCFCAYAHVPHFNVIK